MLLHHGATVEVGHYTAIVRVGGQCFTCDDLTVTPSTSHQLSDAGRSVYICLYEKTGLWFLYYLYPLRTHVFLFAVTAHLYPFFSFEQLYCSTNPKEKAAISFAFVRSDTYTCGIAEARESCSVSTDSPSSVIVVDSTDESSSSTEVTSTDAKQATADTHEYVLTPLAFKHPQL